ARAHDGHGRSTRKRNRRTVGERDDPARARARSFAGDTHDQQQVGPCDHTLQKARLSRNVSWETSHVHALRHDDGTTLRRGRREKSVLSLDLREAPLTDDDEEHTDTQQHEHVGHEREVRSADQCTAYTVHTVGERIDPREDREWRWETG